MTKNEAKQLMLEEAYKLNDVNMQSIIRMMVDRCAIPDYFYQVPSSSSGKYHPEDELEPGGLVLHTIKCVRVAETMARMYQLTKDELELAKTALLLHDTCKNGLTHDSGHTEFAHPLFAAENLLIEMSKEKHNKYFNRDVRKVAKLIRPHMGQWNTNEHEPDIILPLPKTKLEKFVHECDYIASRKEFIIKVD